MLMAQELGEEEDMEGEMEDDEQHMDDDEH